MSEFPHTQLPSASADQPTAKLETDAALEQHRPIAPSAEAASPSATVQWTRAIAVAALLAMIVVGLGWELAWAPLRPGGSWWALKVVPLLWPLVGLLKLRMRNYRSLSLLVWLYVTEGLVRGFSEHGLSATLAHVQSALGVVLFVACAWQIRSRLAAPRLQATDFDSGS